MKHLLPWLRRAVSLMVTAGLLLAFAGCGLPAAALAKLQAGPALMAALGGGAVGIGVLAVLAVVTLLFGRVYCSWLCPLGALQDAANRLARPRHPKRGSYGTNLVWLRVAVAVAVAGALAAGFTEGLLWLDPYSIVGRAATAALRPAALPWWVIGIAAVSLLVPLGLALWRGRLWCNTLCPVGAVLGLLSRRAPLAPHVDTAACVRCGACMRGCKAQAIDVKHHRVDTSRCVACYDCLEACNNRAMRLMPLREKKAPLPETADAGRRTVLGLGLFGLATAALPARAEEAALKAQGVAPAAVPPGAQSAEHLLAHCTACGMCTDNCPTGVLRPSVLALGLRGFMRPYMDYEAASCDYTCHRCSTVCPAGALLPLSLAEKQHTRIARVHYDKRTCIPWNIRMDCGRCAEACPTGALQLETVRIPSLAQGCTGCSRCARSCPQGAITMQVQEDGQKHPVFDYSKCIGCGYCAEACRRRHAIRSTSLSVPVVHAEKCIGCGACQRACPAEPERAMTVTPLAVHETSE